MNNFVWLTNITWIDGTIAVAIFLMFILAGKLFSKYFLKFTAKIAKMSKSRIDEALFSAFRKPIIFILVMTGIYLSLSYLPMPAHWKAALSLLYKSAATFSIGWGFFLFSDAIGIFFNRMGDRFDLQFNNIIIPFLSKLTKFIVVVLTAALILEQWNYHVTGLITGLGIGGLAIAMAAKDTLSNLFGGFVIITDAPFTIGDLIQTGTIEGVVEDINFRSTRIRTPEQALVTVPNSTLANQPITNLSKMEKRRISLNVQLDLETTNEQLTICIQAVRRLLSDDPQILKDGLMVYLDRITSSSKNLIVQFFIPTTEYEEWMKVKEKYNLAILGLLEKQGISLAKVFPRTISDADQSKPKQKLVLPVKPASDDKNLTETVQLRSRK
ncbi:mechanosensitive ion channel family protein [Sporolactobacillus sp. CQH2019]|uniref:mechanosensitive ion channel family protein n=1 Tax=Sporolactobacillus sp. CQH2019 TaxID=3023512 RepID=UPI0023683C75|nr:mechanosensitive ion channel family protein [Sporolactobacillus sp. CQH2019]MDD9148542.1 mechanosensitive ion channel family protein [Sporolactobacillus sp. CQH2019]